jgi:UDP-glucose 4-epimerase
MASNKTILVTGGAGFIGSHTVVQLNTNGYDVVIVDNLSRSDSTLLKGIEEITGKPVDFHEVDCTDSNSLNRVFEHRKIDAVIHFAAYKAVGESVEKPLEYYENNILSLTSLLKAMKKNSVRDIIFSSSCTVYGEPDQIPVTEESPIKPANSPYGATKQMCERILEDTEVLGFNIISLRYFNPIGAHPTALIGELPIGSPNNLVPYITQTAAGIRKQLTIHGNDYNTPDGTCIRDYIHVVDLAEAHVKALEFLQKGSESGYYEVFNLGTGKGISVMELVTSFERVNKLKLNYTIGPRRPGDVEKVYANSALSFSKLKWKPSFTMEDALMHAWQWEKKLRNIN